MLESPYVKTGPDKEILRDYLSAGNKEWERSTVFKNIKRFPLAHSALINLKNVNSWEAFKYYKLYANLEKERFDRERADKFAKEYLTLLTDAVRIRLRSDVPVGCALSGGLDSSSIVYLANEIMKKSNNQNTLPTVSMVHSQEKTKHYDESLYIDLLQRKLGFNSFRCEPIEEDIQNLLQEVAFMMESPPDGLASAGTVTMAAAKKAGLVVTLDGQGADEVQGGYQHYQASYLGSLNIIDFPTQFWAFQKNYEGPKNRKILIMMAALGLKFFGKALTNKFARFFGLRFKIKFDNLNAELLDSVNHGLVNLIHYADSRSMYHTLESRMPFMDHRLIEFSLSVPACYKVHNGYTKYFARLAFNGKLPDEITWRKDKMGWPVPISEWFSGRLGSWSRSVIAGSYLITELNGGNLERSTSSLPVIIKNLNIAIWEKVFWGNRGNKRFKKKIRDENHS